MIRKKNTSKGFLFLVALYANLFFGYQYIQAQKEEHKKNEILIQELMKN